MARDQRRLVVVTPDWSPSSVVLLLPARADGQRAQVELVRQSHLYRAAMSGASAIVARLTRMLHTRRSAIELQALDDRMLADIGLPRTEVRKAARYARPWEL